MDLQRGYLISPVTKIGSVNRKVMKFHQIQHPTYELDVHFITEIGIPIQLKFTQILKEDLDCGKQERYETERIIKFSNDSEN